MIRYLEYPDCHDLKRLANPDCQDLEVLRIQIVKIYKVNLESTILSEYRPGFLDCQDISGYPWII